MDKQIRILFHELIDLVNKYDLPWEVRRIVLENVLYMTEKKADAAIELQIKEEEECKRPTPE